MAESNQRTARAQKALKAQKAQSGAAKAKARQEEEALLRADTFTNAPKVSRRTLTKEEREALAKQREAETKEAEKIASAWSKGGLGRWWAAAIQPRQGHLGHGNRGARRGVRRHRHLALVHRADLPCRSGRAWRL